MVAADRAPTTLHAKLLEADDPVVPGSNQALPGRARINTIPGDISVQFRKVFAMTHA